MLQFTHNEETTMNESTNLLELYPNSVTKPVNEHGASYEIAKCKCDCWFCPECCLSMGLKLRKRLIPILETFDGLFMVSLTIDPLLFPDPKTAYFYTMDKRCISVTTQDLYRANYLITRRYFYVVEWQEHTEQAHFHILYDSRYIPIQAIYYSWSKHRPATAGEIIENRPAFGTVFFSVPKFASPTHAALYATKYLIKTPDYGYPQWLLDTGKDRRIRRYSTSRGFWNEPSKMRSESKNTRKNKQLTYSDRISKCGDSIHLFGIEDCIDKKTGEINPKPVWIGTLKASCSETIEKLSDPGNQKRTRRSLMAESPKEALAILNNVTGRNIEFIRHR